MEKNKVNKNIENIKTPLEDNILRDSIKSSTYKTIPSIISPLRENIGLQIKLLGDSITHGYSGTGFAQDGETIVEGWSINTKGYCFANLLRGYLQSEFVCRVKNFGMSGATSKDLFTNMETLIEAEDDIFRRWCSNL
jgi:lysophospholipase L1-like esterase